MRAEGVVTLGFTLFVFETNMTLWGGLPLSTATGLEFLPLLVYWSVPFCAAMALSLLAAGFLALKMPKALTTSRFIFLGCVAHVAVLFGYIFILFTPEASVVTICIGAFIGGLGLGLSSAAWFNVLAHFESKRVLHLALNSLLLGAFLCLVVSYFFSDSIEAAFFCVIPFAAICLFVSWRFLDKSCTRQFAEIHNASLKQMVGFVSDPLYCCLSIVFAVAIIRMLTIIVFGIPTDVVQHLGLIFIVLGALFFRLINFCFKSVSRYKSLDVPFLFRVLFPMVATLLLFLSVGGASFALPVGSVVFAIFSVILTLMLSFCAEVAEVKSVSPLSVYGLFAGVLYLVFAFATLLGAVFLGDVEHDSSIFLVCLIIAFYVLAIMFFLMERRSRGKENIEVETNSLNHFLQEDRNNQVPSQRLGFADSDMFIEQPYSGDDLIGRRCTALADSYGLTSREFEILVAFAHGRNVAFLAKQLFLSENTVRSHCKTLYAKLGIHDKQTLIDMVESVELSENALET